MQEVSSWTNEVAVDGFVVVHKYGNPAAILIPGSLSVQFMQWEGDGHVAARVDDLCIVSVYFPDCSKPVEEYA